MTLQALPVHLSLLPEPLPTKINVPQQTKDKQIDPFLSCLLTERLKVNTEFYRIKICACIGRILHTFVNSTVNPASVWCLEVLTWKQRILSDVRNEYYSARRKYCNRNSKKTEECRCKCNFSELNLKH